MVWSGALRDDTRPRRRPRDRSRARRRAAPLSADDARRRHRRRHRSASPRPTSSRVDGHEVTVFERRGSVAAETQLRQRRPGRARLRHAVGRAGHAGQGAAPSARRARAGAARRPRSTPRTLGWVWRWWRACRPRDLPRQPRCACSGSPHFSRERLHELTRRLQLDYERSAGLPRAAAHARATSRSREPGVAALAELGVALRASSTPRAAARSSPASTRRRRCTPASTLPDDEVGNCRQFAHLLRKRSASAPARASASTPTVERDRAGARRRSSSACTRRRRRDAPTALRSRAAERLVATRSRGRRDQPSRELRRGRRLRRARSRRLLRPLGVQPAAASRCYGYSVTAPLRHDEQHLAPRAARRR